MMTSRIILAIKALFVLCLVNGGNSCAQQTSISTSIEMPRYVVYYNSKASPLSAAVETDYTHIIISFIRVIVSPSGQLQVHLPVNMEDQWSAISSLHERGKKILISYGGGEVEADEYTALIGHEKKLAIILADVVKHYNLDGVDIDFEASEMFHQKRAAGIGDGRAFLIALTSALRNQLPAPRYEITHAPEPPYLDSQWHGGPYLDVLHRCGEMIDWITVQYYNNPGFNDPLGDSITAYINLTAPNGALGWPANKVLVGKPIYKADANNGYLSPDAMTSNIVQPLMQNFGRFFGGLTGWQFSTKTKDHQTWNDLLGKSLQINNIIESD